MFLACRSLSHRSDLIRFSRKFFLNSLKSLMFFEKSTILFYFYFVAFFSIIISSTLSNENLRIWQIIIRVNYGLFIYLPVLVGSFCFNIFRFIKLNKPNNYFLNNISFSLLSIFFFAVILPNMFFFSNERYIFMVFPALLITLLQFIDFNSLKSLNNFKNENKFLN